MLYQQQRSVPMFLPQASYDQAWVQDITTNFLFPASKLISKKYLRVGRGGGKGLRKEKEKVKYHKAMCY